MDSAALTSLTPLFDEIDKWVELAPLLPVIVSLELVLSADNAVALAAISKKLKDKESRVLALNFGIFISLIFRVLLIIFAQYILRYSQIKLLGGIYLLYLSIGKIIDSYNINNNESISNPIKDNSSKYSLLGVILLIAITDLAFSIDSVTAAVAISDQLLLVITGALIGVLALRFTSGLFLNWLEKYNNLESAGFLAIGIIGLKLIFQTIFPLLLIPEYIIFIIMLVIFLWGFSDNNSKDYL